MKGHTQDLKIMYAKNVVSRKYKLWISFVYEFVTIKEQGKMIE